MAEIDIIARLKLAGEGFNREFKQNLGRMEADAKSSSNRIKSAFSGLKGIGAGIIAGIGVSTFVNLAKGGLEYASSLGEVSQQLGVSSKALQEYRYIATQVGIDQDKMDAGLQRLTKSIGQAREGNKGLKAAFAELKVSLTDSNGKTRETGDVLHDLVGSFSAIQDPAKRARLETVLFGKAGQQLDTLLAGGVSQVDNLRKAVHEMGGVLTEEQIKRADDAADKYAALQTVLKARIAGEVADNVASIMSLGNSLISLVGAAGKAVAAFREWKLEVAERQNENIRDGWFVSEKDKNAAIARIRAIRDELNRLQVAKSGRFTDFGSAGFDIPRPFARPAASSDFKGASPGALRAPPGPLGSKAINASAFGLGGASSLSGIDFDQVMRLAAEKKALEGVTVATVATTKAQAGLKVVFAQVDAQLEESIPKYGEMAQEVADLLEESARRVNEFYDKINIDPVQDMKNVVDAIDARKQKEFDAIEEAAQHRYEVGRDTEDRLASMYETLFTQGTGAVWKDFKAQGLRMIAQIAAQYTLSLLSGQKGGMQGAGGIGGFLGSIFGSGGGAAGSAGGIGGTLQGLASSLGQAGGPISAGIALNQGISKLLGNDQRKNGMALSLLVGPFLAAVIAKAKKGSATLGFSDGSLGVGSTRGNSKSRIEAASGGITAVSDNLQQIADALGGTITGAGSVSLGVRKKSYRVDTTGQGRTKGAGVLDFGKDEQAAIRAATLDALKDGVIGGISEASKRILAAGKDLQKSIEKASLIEAIPKALKARLDPVGAAIDEVNDRWKKTIAALKEGGATAQQMTDAQKLYNLELSDAKTVSNGARASLKEFLDSLNFGSSSPLDLRTQEASAKAALQPFLDQIQAGTLTDQAGYQQAAGAFLDIERQINGSTRAFFDEFEKIQAATAQAIASIDAAAPIRSPTTDLFAEATANATQATANISQQQLDQLAQIRALLANSGLPGTASAFIGAPRNFAFA